MKNASAPGLATFANHAISPPVRSDSWIPVYGPAPARLFSYGLLQNDELFRPHSKTLDALEREPQVIPPKASFTSMDEAWDFIQQWEGQARFLPYEIDGIVVKVDRVALQDELASPAKPRAGRSLTSTRARAESPSWKDIRVQSAARENSLRGHAGPI